KRQGVPGIAVLGIVDRNRQIRDRLGKVATPLQRAGHGRDLVEGISRTRAEVAGEEESAVVREDFRNAQRAAADQAEAALGVGGFRDRLSTDGVGFGVHRRVPQREGSASADAFASTAVAVPEAGTSAHTARIAAAQSAGSSAGTLA